MTRQELISRSGEEINREFINQIITNFYITRHALKEVRERTEFKSFVVNIEGKTFSDGTPMVDFRETIFNIRDAIRDYTLAYINTDGSVNIALSDYDYFVFEYDDIRGQWILVTWKEKSWNAITIQEKLQMAKNGFARKLVR